MFQKSRLYRLPNGLAVQALSKTDTDLVYEEIFVEDVYRQHGVTLDDCKCIVDIGANTGLFEVFLNQIAQSVTVYACEPIPAIFEVLSANLQKLDQINAIPLNVGIGSEKAKETFFVFPRLSCASTMYPDLSAEEQQRGRNYVLDQFRTHPSRPLQTFLRMLPSVLRNGLAELVRRYFAKRVEVECQLLSLPDLMVEHSIESIDLLKLDAERSERDILFSIEEHIWPAIRQVVVEVHEGIEASQAIEQLLAKHGFNVAVYNNPHFPNIFMLYGIRPAAEATGC